MTNNVYRRKPTARLFPATHFTIRVLNAYNKGDGDNGNNDSNKENDANDDYK